MIKVGEHVTLDIIGTKKEYEPSFFEGLVYKIADKAKVTVLNIAKYKFEPQGFTLVALIAESHISFHTYPEKGIISFDFYTCGIISPSVALDIIKKEIDHKRIIKKEISRDTISYYHDLTSTKGLQKNYLVKEVLEDFTSKAGQHIEILDLVEYGKSLFINNDLQVAESDEHIYSGTFVILKGTFSESSQNCQTAIDKNKYRWASDFHQMIFDEYLQSLVPSHYPDPMDCTGYLRWFDNQQPDDNNSNNHNSNVRGGGRGRGRGRKHLKIVAKYSP